MEELNGKAGKEALYKFFCDRNYSLRRPLIMLGFDEQILLKNEHRFGGFGSRRFWFGSSKSFFRKTLR
jgi:hypothetical protein